MNIHNELRSGIDRRVYNLNSPLAKDGRTNPERRQPRDAGHKVPDDDWVQSEGYWGESEDDSSRE